MRGDAPHACKRGDGEGVATGSEANDRGLVRMATLWSRWTHDGGGLSTCWGGSAVVGIVVRQIR
jgi:hypothetical protein